MPQPPATPQPPAAIANSRLTLIRGEAFFEHLADAGRPLTEMPWLGADFSRVFGRLRGAGGHPRYAFAWRPSQSSSFWRAYCGSRPLQQLSAEAAFGLLVPFRLVPAQRPSVRIEGGAARASYDVYGHAFGLVVALTLQQPMGRPMPLDGWRDWLRGLRSGRDFALTLPGASEVTGMREREVLERLTDWHRDEFFGPIGATMPSSEPFSFVTVIQGDGVDPTVPFKARMDLRRTLEAVTTWPVNWAATSLPDVAKAVLPVGGDNPSAGDALYASRRGRTLWRPALFGYRAPAAGARIHTLGCLSHNLVAGSVQAEALRLFALGWAALDGAARARVPVRLRASAATQIDRLWRGRETYRSSSIERLLRDPTSLAEVNALLVEMGQEPIPG